MGIANINRCLFFDRMFNCKNGPKNTGNCCIAIIRSIILISRSDRPIYSLVLGTKVMIVLLSDDAVSDVLVKKSGNYSDRPDMFIG